MSKLNISGVVKQIKSRANAYLPLVEAIVNSIDSIRESGRQDGYVNVIIKRDCVLELDSDFLAPIQSVEIVDNGIGFTPEHRDSFDTFYSALKLSQGGKGFGRFMFLKYFSSVNVNSVYATQMGLFRRTFDFGTKYDIIINEKNVPIESSPIETHVFLNNLLEPKYLDKGIETIARKILENLLVFFINQDLPCPKITIIDSNSGDKVVLNEYLVGNNDIVIKDINKFSVESAINNQTYNFVVSTFQVFYANNQKSKIILTGHNREVTESTLSQYIPEFEDDFYEEEHRGKDVIRKNYIIVTYVSGSYLDETVSLERETFDFEKNNATEMYPLSQTEIERATASIVSALYDNDVKIRENKKVERIKNYINNYAPWHKQYYDSLQLNSVPFHASEEQIELALQKEKFKKETQNRIAIKEVLAAEDGFEENLSDLVSSITQTSKDDLVHYVCIRREVLKLFQKLLRRNENGEAELEKEIHNLIFPMGGTSEDTIYENHNLWLLDERLVFSEFIASDRKISSLYSPTEPDLVIFDHKRLFRNGDNEYSNPVTVFEFKRPKRTNYAAKDDPIAQIGNYVEEIRAGKYETPNGIEKVKVNNGTPIYGYLVCDPCAKIDYFAKVHQLTKSPDDEGYYGYHTGYGMYIEILSYKRLLSNSELRNKIFFSKLHID